MRDVPSLNRPALAADGATWGMRSELAAYQLRTKKLLVCQPTRAPSVAYAQFVIAREYGFDVWADGTSLSAPYTSLWEPKSLHG